MTTGPSIVYFSATILLVVTVHMLMPVLLRKLREFERDCELWEAHNAPKKILPSKERAVDDANSEADRPDRELMKVLNGLPVEAVR